MPKLIHSAFVKDEEHCIAMMLETILPFVEESYIMVDDRTTDRTKEIAESYGCKTKLFTFKNFGKTKNTLMYWTKDKSDWVFGLAPDEKITLDLGKKLNKIVHDIHDHPIDGVYFSRRHWSDLDMKDEYTKQNWYPDWQQRLIRNDFPRVHMVHYVHEVVVGLRKSLWVKEDLHHFNMYWKPRIDYDFEKMNVLYRELKKKQSLDGGRDIWPEGITF